MTGEATTSHLARRGHQVNLWGTELDEEIIGLLLKSTKHKILDFYSGLRKSVATPDQLSEAETVCNVGWRGLNLYFHFGRGKVSFTRFEGINLRIT